MGPKQAAALAKERYRYKRWHFYKYSSKRPPAERAALRLKWWNLYEEAHEARVALQKSIAASAHGISINGLNFIKKYEGFSSHIYGPPQDVRTIGYGTTESDVNPLPTYITEKDAARRLERKVDEKYYPAVAKALAPLNPSQNMIDAACSFAYNLGEGAFEGAHGFETLTRAIKAKSRAQIAEAFLLYDSPGTVFHAGLAARRKAERKLFLK